MSFFPSVLRPALLALATLAFVPSPSITVTVAGVTAMTVMTSSQAEAGRPAEGARSSHTALSTQRRRPGLYEPLKADIVWGMPQP